jgi:hypothetical protein
MTQPIAILKEEEYARVTIDAVADTDFTDEMIQELALNLPETALQSTSAMEQLSEGVGWMESESWRSDGRTRGCVYF